MKQHFRLTTLLSTGMALSFLLSLSPASKAEYGDCIKTWYTSDANKDYYGGLAWKGDYWTGYLYENHSETKHLLKLDPTVPDGSRARVLSSIQYTGSTSDHGDIGLAWDPTNNCWWLTDPWADRSIYRMDAEGGGWLSSFSGISNAHDLHFDEENTLLYVSSNVKDYFKKYDVSNPNNPVNVGGDITTGGDIPFAAPGIAVVGDKIWVTAAGKSIYELNLDGTRTGRRIRIPESPSDANAAMLTFDGRYIWVRGNVTEDDQLRIYQMDIGLPPPATPTPITTPTPQSPIIDSGDYNGDSTSDIAVFRASAGLWAIRGITRTYFGANGDVPAPGDYDGDGNTDIALFRASSGLWAVKGQTRVYFGASGDTAAPGDYEGSGTCGSAIFRPASGLWAIRGVTRVYFGASSDRPVPVYASGRSMGKDIAIFRPNSGLWAIRGLSRTYFGASSDTPVPGNYTAYPGNLDIGIFRNSSGLWAIKDLTRIYFGGSHDIPVAGNYTGGIPNNIGIFRAGSGLWAIRGVTRAYFGTAGDIPVTGEAMEHSHDYLVLDSGDYNGDGTGDVAIFRPSNGLWSVKGITRAYFGEKGNIPVPGDYSGNGTTDIAVYNNSTRLWSVRNITRIYFSNNLSGIPVPGDYTGDNICDPALFQDGLWSIRVQYPMPYILQIQHGKKGDQPVPDKYSGKNFSDIAFFRPSTGLWAIKDLTRIYFGGAWDIVAPADYNGDGTTDPAVYRPDEKLWAVRSITRVKFTESGQIIPIPFDYRGDGTDDIARFNNTFGLWSIRSCTEIYFGHSGDLPVSSD